MSCNSRDLLGRVVTCSDQRNADTGAMVERYAHLAPEALQGAANRIDAFGGYAAATPSEKGSAQSS